MPGARAGAATPAGGSSALACGPHANTPCVSECHTSIANSAASHAKVTFRDDGAREFGAVLARRCKQSARRVRGTPAGAALAGDRVCSVGALVRRRVPEGHHLLASRDHGCRKTRRRSAARAAAQRVAPSSLRGHARGDVVATHRSGLLAVRHLSPERASRRGPTRGRAGERATGCLLRARGAAAHAAGSCLAALVRGAIVVGTSTS